MSNLQILFPNGQLLAVQVFINDPVLGRIEWDGQVNVGPITIGSVTIDGQPIGVTVSNTTPISVVSSPSTLPTTVILSTTSTNPVTLVSTTLPLPTGAATAALQSTLNTDLENIIGTVGSFLPSNNVLLIGGDDTGTGSRVARAQFRTITANVTGPGLIVRDPSCVIVDGAGLVGGAYLIASKDPGLLSAHFLTSLNAAPATTDRGIITRNIPSGIQPISATTLPLPTGSATSTNQTTQISLFSSIIGGEFDTTPKPYSIQLGGAASVGGEFHVVSVTNTTPGDFASSLVVRNRSALASIAEGIPISADGLGHAIALRNSTSGGVAEPILRTATPATTDRGIVVRIAGTPNVTVVNGPGSGAVQIDGTVDVTSFNGNPIDTSTGNATVGTLRTVLASDQPAIPITSTTLATEATSLDIESKIGTIEDVPSDLSMLDRLHRIEKEIKKNTELTASESSLQELIKTVAKLPKPTSALPLYSLRGIR